MPLCGATEDGMAWDLSLKMPLTSLRLRPCNMFVSVLVLIIVQTLLEATLLPCITGSPKTWKTTPVSLPKNYISGA